MTEYILKNSLAIIIEFDSLGVVNRSYTHALAVANTQWRKFTIKKPIVYKGTYVGLFPTSRIKDNVKYGYEKLSRCTENTNKLLLFIRKQGYTHDKSIGLYFLLSTKVVEVLENTRF